MERKKFLKSGLSALGMLTVLPIVESCKKASTTTSGSGSGSGSGGSSGGGSTSCTVAPTETEGPFPTKQPASYVRSNIVDGRIGVSLTIQIYIKSVSGGCNALAGALVDIWHCDAAGNYSEYGGTTMQQTNYTAVHFLRGRQITDSNGLVTFTTVFPGWYTGRATHIHVHVYNASGVSLKVTQIAFPEGASSATVAVNAQSSLGYTKGMAGYTYNANDNVFSDDTAGVQIGAITGSLSSGYTLTQTINV